MAIRPELRSVCSATLLLFFVSGPVLKGQEIKYIDLSLVQQRTELRHPRAPALDSHGLGAGSGGASVRDGAPDRRDPHSLAIYLSDVSSTEIAPDDPFEIEFKLFNSGRAPIEIPVSPHLSDLQPTDESLEFTYMSVALVVRAVADSQGPDPGSLGFVQLYGSPDHEGSMLVLKPGEWVRIKAKVTLSRASATSVTARLQGEFWLRRNIFRPQRGGGFLEVQNLYPNTSPTASIPVHLTWPTPSKRKN